MRCLILFIFFGLSTHFVQAQCDSTQWAEEGTYQLERINGATEAINNTRTPLTSDQLCLIESSRQDYHFVILKLDAYTRVKIYPRYTNSNSVER